jgi:hypothetical protein
MNETAPAIPTPDVAPTVEKKPRGRPAGRPRLADSETPKPKTHETPQQKIERLQAELQQAHEAKKIADQHRDSLVGSVVVAHALAHADYKRQLATILRAEIKNKADLAAIAELLT